MTTGLPNPGRRWKRGERNIAFRITSVFVIPLFRWVSAYRWHGPNRLPEHGAFVLAPNHYTNIDPLVVGTAVWVSRRLPRFLAKASIFRVPVVGRLMTGMGQIPVERSGRTRLNDPLGGGRYAREFDEVKRLGAAGSERRTADQTDAARYWMEGRSSGPA